MNDTPPVIGAALALEDLETYRDWLVEHDRDLELQGFHMAEVLDGDWESRADRVLGALDGFRGRLGIHGPFWGFSIASEDPEIQQIVTKRMMQGLDVCARLKATQMVIHSPFNHWDHHNFPARPSSRSRVHENARTTLEPVLARAESQGVTLVVENIADVDPFDRLRLVEALGSPALKISIDTGHAQFAHTATGAPPVDYFVRAAGEMLNHVHLQDADGYADRHWAIGDGTILWSSVFGAILATGSKPHLVLELADKSGIPRSMTYLQGLGLVR